ncbi:hypothetical protein ACFSHQ_09735 [Gemmobacter lanyuensis]
MRAGHRPFGRSARDLALPRRRGDGGATRSDGGTPDALVTAAKLGGAVGFVVADTETGAVLEAANPDLQQPPPA